MMRLGDLQLRIMQVLWQADEPLAVAEVQQHLEGEPLAYTTVATMLRKMEQRGLVRHRAEGRRFLYEPLVSVRQVSRGLSRDLIDRLFGGSLAATVSHLLETREVDSAELERLEKLIRAHKKRP